MSHTTKSKTRTEVPPFQKCSTLDVTLSQLITPPLTKLSLLVGKGRWVFRDAARTLIWFRYCDHVLQGKLGPCFAPGPDTLPTEVSFFLSMGFCCSSIPFRSEGKSASERKLLAKSSLLLGKECKVGMPPVALFPRAIMQIDYGGNHSSYLGVVRSNVSKLRTAERANEEKLGPWCPF